MKKVIILFILALILTGCYEKSVCDSRGNQVSVLCEIEDTTGIKLKATGDAIMVLNAGTILSGQYTPEEAAKVLRTIRHIVDGSPSYLQIQSSILRELKSYPELFTVGAIFISRMKDQRMLTDFDRAILINWLDARIVAMEAWK